MNGSGTGNAVLARFGGLAAGLASVDARHVPAGAPLFDTDEGAKGGLALDPLDAVKLAVVLPEEHGPGVAGETGYEMVLAARWFAELVSALSGNGGA